MGGSQLLVAQDQDLFSRGIRAYNDGHYSQSEKLLETYLRDNPDSLVRDIGMLWYGRSLLALNRVSEARRVVESMKGEFPNSPLTTKLNDEVEKRSQTPKRTEKGGSVAQTPTGKGKEFHGAPVIQPRRVAALESKAVKSSLSGGPVHQTGVNSTAKPRSGHTQKQTQATAPRVPVVSSAATKKAAIAKSPTKAAGSGKKQESIETNASTAIFRDPFRPLVMRSSEDVPLVLPPGKKGLLINRLELKGIVKAGDGYMAIVLGESGAGAIFLHDSDVLFDGNVEKIYPDHVVFKRLAKDKLGKTYTEEVTKRLPGGF